MTREQYYESKRLECKEIIKKIIDVFFLCDGDFTKIGVTIGKSKSSISRFLGNAKYNEIFLELIDEGSLDRKTLEKIRIKIEENKIKGNEKGGNSFKEKYEVEFNKRHRITKHVRKL